MIYNPNPSYKENPLTKIEILNGATVFVWETLDEYVDTVTGNGGRWIERTAVPGKYWVNAILDIPNIGIQAVCLYDAPQFRYRTTSMSREEYIAWGVPVGQYLIV